MPKKFFFLIFIFFFFLLFSAKATYAQTMTLSPSEITTSDQNGIDVKITGLFQDTEYGVWIQKDGTLSPNNVFGIFTRKPDPSGNLALKICGNFAVENSCSGKGTFDAGSYKIWVSKSFDGNKIAIAGFNVRPATTDIEVTFLNTSWTNTDDVIVKLDKVSDGGYIFKVDNQDPNKNSGCQTASNGSVTLNIGHYYEKPFPHTLTVYDSRGWLAGLGCNPGNLVAQRTFKIANDGSGGAGPVVPPQTKLTINLSGVSGKQSRGELCNNDKGVETAIGCIPTDLTEFVKGFLKFAVAIAGGIALLIMVFGSFKMITSAGNPDSLKEGQEMFTNAIIGLLFIIFSTLLLKIIGVDILGLGKFLGV